MARVITLVLFVALGLAFLSRSCTDLRSPGPIALMHGRIVSVTGFDESARFMSIAGGKIAAVSLDSDNATPTVPSGFREIDVTGLYIAAATFDRSASPLIDGIRHVWVGQVAAGDPGDVVIMRDNPGRVRPGYIPGVNAVVGAVIDGVYYTARELNRRR